MAERKLTVKQERFVEEFVRTGNAAAAYREVYDVRKMTQTSIYNASQEMMALPSISNEIEKLRASKRVVQQERFLETTADLLEFCRDILLADPNELIVNRVGCCRYCYGADHGYQWRDREYLEAVTKAEAAGQPLPEIHGGFGFNHVLDPVDSCTECRGEGVARVVPMATEKLSRRARMLLRGVKQRKEGIEIMFADKEKYFEYACRLLGAFDDRLRIDANTIPRVKELLLKAEDPRDAMQAYEKLLAFAPGG